MSDAGRYITWRDGRPRFSPSPQLREAGHKSHDLKHEDGRWFTKEETNAWSDAMLEEALDAGHITRT
jgi:hypothetical protein